MDLQSSIRLQISQLKRILRHRTEFSTLPSEKISEFYLKNQISETRSDYKDFMKTHKQLVAENTTEDFEKTQYFIEKTNETYELCYFEFISNLEEKLRNLPDSKNSPTKLSNSNENSMKASIKLPPISPPTFSGKPID